jgi:hypothetical protein
LKSAPNFFLAGTKAQCDERGGRILLGDNTGGGTVTLRSIKFQCFGIALLYTSICTYISLCIAVAQLVEALSYKPEGHGFDSRLCHWDFSFTYSFRSHCGRGVDSASNRNEYQEYFLGGKGCVGLTTLPPSCADCLEIWEPQPPGILMACPGL